MSDAKDLFEQGEEVTELFESGEDVSEPAQVLQSVDYEPAANEDTSAIEAFGATMSGRPVGLKQGLALGFADEIAAGAGALGAATGGDPRSFGDIYKDILDVVRQEKKTAEEQHPIASTVGEIAGGMAVPIGVAGAPAKAIKIAPGLAGPVRAAPTFLQKAIPMASAGAKVGAIAGLGTSEADLLSGEPGQITEAIEDISTGALGGAVAGAGMQALGSGVSTAADEIGAFFTSTPLFKDLTSARNFTLAGKDIVNKSTELVKESRDFATHFIEQLETMQSLAGDLVGKSRKEIDELLPKMNIEGTLDDLSRQLDALEPSTTAEANDIKELKKVLKSALQEQTKITKKYLNPELAGFKAPELTAEEKALKQAASETTTLDLMADVKRAELQNAATEAYLAGDNELGEQLSRQAEAQAGDTMFPPSIVEHPMTGLSGQVVARGASRRPVVKVIKETPEPFVTKPLIKTERTTTRGRTEASLGELDKILKSLYELRAAMPTGMGKDAAGKVNTAIREIEDKAISASADPDVKDLSGLLKEAKSAYHEVTNTIERLGLPGKAFTGTEKHAREKAISQVQSTILSFEKGAIGESELRSALEDAAKVFPVSVDKLLEQAVKQKEQVRLAHLLESRSGLATTDIPGLKISTGVSVPRMAAYTGVRVAKAEKAVKEGAEQVGKYIQTAGTKVYDMSPEVLQQVAAIATEQGQGFANVLAGMVTQPLQKRRALMFGLMQQPGYREWIEKNFIDETNEEQQ